MSAAVEVLRPAQKQDIPELLDLWLAVFDEKREAAELFFNRNLNYTHGYIAQLEGRIIAAVYLIDGSVNGRKAHYLCGAGTLPEFRGRGVMSRLIGFALADAKNRGDVYSLLYPANDGLYDFYARLGYQSVCTQTARAFTRQSLREAFEAENQPCSKANILLQNNSFMDFAIHYYACYGVRAVRYQNCFALTEENKEEAVVFYFDYDDPKAFAEMLLQNSRAERITLCGKSDSPLLKGGEPERCGMAKQLGTLPLPRDIYIGITLN